MSELQLGLLGIGILVVVGVLAYNKLQEIKLRRRTEEAFSTTREDVLVGDVPAARRVAAAKDFDERIEPVFAPEPVESPAGGGNLDACIDFIATLELATPIPGEAISAAIVDNPTSAKRCVIWECLNPQTGNWEPLAAAGEYRRLRVGLQLADRNGAVSQEELAEFCTAVQSIAEAIGAECALAESSTALQRAQQLDALCADVDVQIGLNLISRGGAIAGTRIRTLAEAQGLILERDGRFHRRDENGVELYTLCNMEEGAFSADGMKTLATRGVTLLFDVARVPEGITAFDRFADFARTLAEALSASVVDDNRQPLDEAALGKIRAQMQARFVSMEEQGIPPGGPLALRLLS